MGWFVYGTQALGGVLSGPAFSRLFEHFFFGRRGVARDSSHDNLGSALVIMGHPSPLVIGDSLGGFHLDEGAGFGGGFGEDAVVKGEEG